MPIFEYICKDCGKHFEAVIFGANKAECPACSGKELEQQLSTFAVSTGSSSRPSMPCGAPQGSCGGGSCGLKN